MENIPSKFGENCFNFTLEEVNSCASSSNEEESQILNSVNQFPFVIRSFFEETQTFDQIRNINNHVSILVDESDGKRENETDGSFLKMASDLWEKRNKIKVPLNDAQKTKFLEEILDLLRRMEVELSISLSDRQDEIQPKAHRFYLIEDFMAVLKQFRRDKLEVADKGKIVEFSNDYFDGIGEKPTFLLCQPKNTMQGDLLRYNIYKERIGECFYANTKVKERDIWCTRVSLERDSKKHPEEIVLWIFRKGKRELISLPRISKATHFFNAKFSEEQRLNMRQKRVIQEFSKKAMEFAGSKEVYFTTGIEIRIPIPDSTKISLGRLEQSMKEEQKTLESNNPGLLIQIGKEVPSFPLQTAISENNDSASFYNNRMMRMKSYFNDPNIRTILFHHNLMKTIFHLRFTESIKKIRERMIDLRSKRDQNFGGNSLIFEGTQWFVPLQFRKDLLVDQIIANGGKIRGSIHSPHLTHVVVNRKEELRQIEHGILVYPEYIEICIQTMKLHPVSSSILSPSFNLNNSSALLNNQRILVVGFSELENKVIFKIIQLLGAQVVSHLANENSILVTKEPNGTQYETAIVRKIPIVSRDWIFACAISGKWESENNFTIGKWQNKVSKQNKKEMDHFSSADLHDILAGAKSINLLPKNLNISRELVEKIRDMQIDLKKISNSQLPKSEGVESCSFAKLNEKGFITIVLEGEKFNCEKHSILVMKLFPDLPHSLFYAQYIGDPKKNRITIHFLFSEYISESLKPLNNSNLPPKHILGYMDDFRKSPDSWYFDKSQKFSSSHSVYNYLNIYLESQWIQSSLAFRESLGIYIPKRGKIAASESIDLTVPPSINSSPFNQLKRSYDIIDIEDSFNPPPSIPSESSFPNTKSELSEETTIDITPPESPDPRNYSFEDEDHGMLEQITPKSPNLEEMFLTSESPKDENFPMWRKKVKKEETIVPAVPSTSFNLQLEQVFPSFLSLAAETHSEWILGGLLEFIHNSMDAQASFCHISTKIEEDKRWKVRDSHFKLDAAVDYLYILDDGTGMSREELNSMLSFDDHTNKNNFKTESNKIGSQSFGAKRGMIIGRNLLVITKNSTNFLIGVLSLNTLTSSILSWKNNFSLDKETTTIEDEKKILAIVSTYFSMNRSWISHFASQISSPTGTLLIFSDLNDEWDFISDSKDIQIKGRREGVPFMRGERREYCKDISIDYSLRSLCEIVQLDRKMTIVIRGEEISFVQLQDSLKESSTYKNDSLECKAEIGMIPEFKEKKLGGHFIYWKNVLIESFIKTGGQSISMDEFGIVSIVNASKLRVNGSKTAFKRNESLFLNTKEWLEEKTKEYLDSKVAKQLGEHNQKRRSSEVEEEPEQITRKFKKSNKT